MNDVVRVQDLIVSRVTLGELESNAKDVLAQLKESLAAYTDKTYSDEEISQAKEERARLVAMAEKVNSERLAYERKWMEPFDPFKNTANDIVKEIKGVVKAIDKSIIASEERRREKKLQDIELAWKGFEASKLVPLSRFIPDQWLNKSETLSRIKKALAEQDINITSTLHDLGMLEAGAEEAKKVYLETLSISDAYRKAQEVATIIANNKPRSAPAEVIPAADMLIDTPPAYQVPVEPVTQEPMLSAPIEEEPVFTFTLELTGTARQLKALREYIDKAGIKYKKIQ
jgi:hypothetical protein